MADDLEYREEPRDAPLDFSKRQHLSRCPYCGETLSAQELQGLLAQGTNTFVCPNCRKKLNPHELGRGI